jgi:hypothetical protein
MENGSSAREIILDKWEWEKEELDFVNGLNEAQCSQLLSNMKKASFYSSMFSISKYSIFVLFIAVYSLRYFHQDALSLIIQMIIIPAGILAVFSFFMLKKVETDPNYKSLFLDGH